MFSIGSFNLSFPRGVEVQNEPVGNCAQEFIEFKGVQLGANPDVFGPPLESKNQFLSYLDNIISTETFAAFGVGDLTGTSSIDILDYTATLTFISSYSRSIGQYSATGRFDTTLNPSINSRYLESAGSFTINFDRPIRAFGFYGTDWGDVLAGASIELYSGNSLIRTSVILEKPSLDGLTESEIYSMIDNTTAGGSLYFYGFVDGTGTTYDSVTILIQQQSEAFITDVGVDYFGFDDIIIGVPRICSLPCTNAVTLTFEGLQNQEPIENFYNGGTGGNGSSSTTNYGVVFSSNALGLIDADAVGLPDAPGWGNFGNEPSPSTVMIWLDEINPCIMNVSSGFAVAISFWYSTLADIYLPDGATSSVKIYDDLNGTGNLLGTFTIQALGGGSTDCGDPTGDFCRWDIGWISFEGIAKSAVFSGVADQVGFDDISFCVYTEPCFDGLPPYGNISGFDPAATVSVDTQTLYVDILPDYIDTAQVIVNVTGTTGNLYSTEAINAAQVLGNTLAGSEVTVFFANNSFETTVFQSSEKFGVPGANAIGSGWHISIYGDTFDNVYTFSTTIPVNKIYFNLVSGNALFDVTSYTFGTAGSLLGNPFSIAENYYSLPDSTLEVFVSDLYNSGFNFHVNANYSDRLFVVSNTYPDLFTSLTVDFLKYSNGSNVYIPVEFVGTLHFYADSDSANTMVIPYCAINTTANISGLNATTILGDPTFYLNATCVTSDQELVTFFGMNQSGANVITGDPLTKKQEFLSFLRDVRIEDFEAPRAANAVVGTIPYVSAPLALNFIGAGANTTATLFSISGSLLDGYTGIFDAPYEGRFNTTANGTNYLDSTNSFYIDFSGNGVSAFGFYGLDIGDKGGNLSIILTDSSNVTYAPILINTFTGGSSQSSIFWGFADSSKQYKRVVFVNSTGNVEYDYDNDVFGFDDLIVGTPKICGEALFTMRYNTSLNSNAPIQLPLDGQVNITVDWGDGSVDVYNSSTIATHQYSTSGIYDVNIFGTLTTFGNSTISQTSLISVFDWGNLGLQNLSYAFNGATNLSFVPAELPTTVSNVSGMFSGCQTFNINVDNWNTANITDMSNMFDSCVAFNVDISGWTVSKVTSTSGMFKNCYSFNRSLNSWNVANVVNMSSMFESASVFNQSLSTWNVSKVTNMSSMFKQASAFNGSIAAWNIKSTNMNSMFESATAFNIDISSWNVVTVSSMNSMFKNASAFNRNLSGWCVINIASEPTDFSTGASSWTLAKPIWGTCPNSNTPTSIAISLPTSNLSVSTSGSHLSNNVAWYSFTTSTTGPVTISTGGTIDSMIGVYNAAGNLMGYDDDSGPGTLSLLTTNLSSGTYYIAVGRYYVNYITTNFGAVGDSAVPSGITLSVTN